MVTAARLDAQVPAPGLAINLTATNQIQIQITNGVSTANYELYTLVSLGDPWVIHTTGVSGQTNFSVDLGVFSRSFFLVAVGSDWDSDGIPNSIDGQPTNASIGVLSITIDSPVNGTNIQ